MPDSKTSKSTSRQSRPTKAKPGRGRLTDAEFNDLVGRLTSKADKDGLPGDVQSLENSVLDLKQHSTAWGALARLIDDPDVTEDVKEVAVSALYQLVLTANDHGLLTADARNLLDSKQRSTACGALTTLRNNLDGPNKAVDDAVANALARLLLTFSEVDDILKARYPTEDELTMFPLGEHLLRIPHVDERYDKHIEGVVNGVNILVSARYQTIVEEWKSSDQVPGAQDFMQVHKQIFGQDDADVGLLRREKQELARIFRLFAVYHDIGKAVIKERHPTVGYYLSKHVYDIDVKRYLYPLLLKRQYSSWQSDLEKSVEDIQVMDLNADDRRLLDLFHIIVRCHDLFGVLSTGEASLPVLGDVIPMQGLDPGDAKEVLSALMIFNLADVYGSIKPVPPSKVHCFCSDWREACDAVEKANGVRRDFRKRLFEKSRSFEPAAERLWRLMREGAPAEWQDQLKTKEMVYEILREVTMYRTYGFADNFALMCKMDYCLSFKLLLMATAKNELTEKACRISVNRMIRLVSEIEKRYGEQCSPTDGRPQRRIGIEMAGLMRKPPLKDDADKKRPSQIGETICKSLLDSEARAMEWAVNECTIWFMEE